MSLQLRGVSERFQRPGKLPIPKKITLIFLHEISHTDMVISSFFRSIFYTHHDSIIFLASYNIQHRHLREMDTYQKVETRARLQSDCLETLTRHHIMSSTMPLPGFETNLTYHHHEALLLLRNSPPRFSGVLPSTIIL